CETQSPPTATRVSGPPVYLSPSAGHGPGPGLGPAASLPGWRDARCVSERTARRPAPWAVATGKPGGYRDEAGPIPRCLHKSEPGRPCGYRFQDLSPGQDE